MGIGIGLVFVPTATIVTRYFSRMRGLAIGIAMSGGPFGGMILTASTFPFLYYDQNKFT
jgi:MFS family permease